MTILRDQKEQEQKPEQPQEQKHVNGQPMWLNSESKHIYLISETDLRTDTNTEIGYCRTRAEANHLIHDYGLKKFHEHKTYRAEKRKYNVTYVFSVDAEETKFEIREQSLGYLYDGPKVVRFAIKFSKIYRSYNTVLSPNEMEQIAPEIRSRD